MDNENDNNFYFEKILIMFYLILIIYLTIKKELNYISF